MANSTVTTLAGLMKTMQADVKAEFLVLPNLVDAVYSVETDSRTTQFPVRGTEERVAVASAESTEGNDLTSSAITVGSVTGALECYPVLTSISSLAIKGGANTVQESSRLIASRVSNAINSGICAVISAIDHSYTTVSGALTIGHFSDAVGVIRDDGYHGKINAVLHPKQYYDADYGLAQSLVGTTNTIGGGAASEEMLRNGWVNNIMGVDIYLSNQVVESGSYARGGIFAKESIGFAYSRPLIEIKANDNPDGTGIKVVGAAHFVCKELDDAGGSVRIDSLIA